MASEAERIDVEIRASVYSDRFVVLAICARNLRQLKEEEVGRAYSTHVYSDRFVVLAIRTRNLRQLKEEEVGRAYSTH